MPNQALIIFLVEKECKEFDSNILGIIVIFRYSIVIFGTKFDIRKTRIVFRTESTT